MSGLQLAVVGEVGRLATDDLAADRRQPPTLRALAEEQALATAEVHLCIGHEDLHSFDRRAVQIQPAYGARTRLLLLALELAARVGTQLRAGPAAVSARDGGEEPLGHDAY